LNTQNRTRKTAKGTVIEGRGVIPDVEVKLSRALLVKKGDPQLEDAIMVIKAKSQKDKSASN
jgi:C-terminal processing protease CtpA/Prc